MAETDSSSVSPISSDSDSNVELEEVYNNVLAYDGEPLAGPNAMNETENDEEVENDPDGLIPAMLEQRYEKHIQLHEWCQCNHCDHALLVGALEYRCCREVSEAYGKVVFEGLTDHVSCITALEDFKGVTNQAVLELIGPLLKDRSGRPYKRRAGQTKNEYLRAVAYRTVTRYFFGYLGWDNSRPLPACVYHKIRTQYPDSQKHGYKSSEQRTL